MRRRLTIGATIVAGLAAWTGAASAGGRIRPDQSALLVGGGSPGAAVSFTEIPVRVRGDLAVLFHGDQATGCAARGLCGFWGTIVWQPPPTATLNATTYRDHGRTEEDVSLQLPGLGSFASPNQGGITTADVRFASNGSSSLCTDATPTGAGISMPVHLRAASISLAAAMPSLLGTRCAGPLQSDVARLLPRRLLDVAALSSGRTAVSLASSGDFAAHGLAGTVTSTVELNLGRPRSPRANNGPSSSNLPRFRNVEVDYRAHLGGSLVVQAHGDPTSCAGLGACGSSTTLALGMHSGAQRFRLDASMPARRPLRDALTALGLRKDGNPRGILVFGSFGEGGFPTTVQVTQGAAMCRDTGHSGPGAVVVIGSAGRLTARFVLAQSALHLRCPGPLFSQGQTLATGATGIGVLHRHGSAIRLRTGVKVQDPGYAGGTVADLALTLSHPKVTVTTDAQPGPG